MYISVGRLCRCLGCLALLVMFTGCSTVSGLGQDIQDGSQAVHTAVWGDDPDAPPND